MFRQKPCAAETCEELFTPRNRRNKYCSKKCGAIAKNAGERERLKDPVERGKRNARRRGRLKDPVAREKERARVRKRHRKKMAIRRSREQMCRDLPKIAAALTEELKDV